MPDYIFHKDDYIFDDEDLLWCYRVTQTAMDVVSVIYVVAILLLAFGNTITSIIGWVCMGLAGIANVVCMTIEHLLGIN